MDSSQTTPQIKQKKGIKRLWERVKASMGTDSSGRGSSSPTSASTPAPTAVAATKAPTQSTLISPPAAQDPRLVAAAADQSTVTESSKIEPRAAMLADKSQEEPAERQPAEPVAMEQSEEQRTENYTSKSVVYNVIEVDELDEPEEKLDIDRKYIAQISGSEKARFARAQAVYKQYNMTLDPADWHCPPRSNVERVEKKIRMRVRWTCHECNTGFAREKLCPKCSHIRCKACIRLPPKKVGDRIKKESSTSRRHTQPMSVVNGPTVGACHECKTEFTIGADRSCTTCKHPICERCLKETVNSNPTTAPPPGIQNIVVSAS